MKYKFRNFNKKGNQNLGFSKSSINLIQKELNVSFPNSYIAYLEFSGIHSNVFDENQKITNESDFVKKMLNLQLEFQNRLDDRKIVLENDKNWCFYKEVKEFTYYYFFYLDSDNPSVFYLLDNDFYEGHKLIKAHVDNRNMSFVYFINHRTKNKYDETSLEKIKSWLFFIITLPLSIASIFGIWLLGKMPRTTTSRNKV